MKIALAAALAHHWASRRLSAYLDGELPERARRSVERHLARCEACVVGLAALRRAQAALRGAPRSAPPEQAWDRLREQMAAPGLPEGLRAVWRRALPRRRAPAAAAAGLLMALGASIYLAYGPGRPAPRGGAITTSFVTTADLVQDEAVPVSPSLELLLVARHNGGPNPREEKR